MDRARGPHPGCCRVGHSRHRGRTTNGPVRGVRAGTQVSASRSPGWNGLKPGLQWERVMTGVMTPGGPSPPSGDWHELRDRYSGIGTVESNARMLLTASIDVVGAVAGDRGAGRAAVYAAPGSERRDAAGT